MLKESPRIFFWSLVAVCFVCPLVAQPGGRNIPLKPIGVDEQTGTRFSIIDKSGGMAGTDPCKGGYGNLDVFGEMPATIALEDDTAARSLAERAKATALKVCPPWVTPWTMNGSVRLWLIKGNFDATAAYADPTYRDFPERVVRAPWEVYSEWEQRNRREPMKHQYLNAAAARAALAKEVIRPISDAKFLFLLGTDTKTGVNFWIYSQERARKCWNFSGGQRDIVGEVPGSISLLDQNLASSLLITGAQLMIEKCGGLSTTTKVFLGPTGGTLGDSYSHIRPLQVEADFFGSQGLKVNNIKNYVVEAELQKIARAKEEKTKTEVRIRYDHFVKTYGVKQWPTIEQLTANPFVYEGSTIAIESLFNEMTTATQGVFTCRIGGADHFLMVSGIPKGTFTKHGSVVLAGRVLGKTELKMGFGSLMVPHLNFVGVHFCADWDCRDIIPK